MGAGSADDHPDRLVSMAVGSSGRRQLLQPLPAATHQARRASKAKSWLDHVHRVYPDDADHIIKWLAHRVQRPRGKINHALVLGGAQGIGKDPLLEPVKKQSVRGISWRLRRSIYSAPSTHSLKSVIFRINEAHDLGELDRFKFYDHAKIYIVAPPDVLRVNEKYIPEHYVPN